MTAQAARDALVVLAESFRGDGSGRCHDLMAILARSDAYAKINTPEIDNFLTAVKNEALHQRERWGTEDDAGKADADWFWLVGYLAGKALHNVNDKRLHHVITAAAALLNWHSKLTGNYAAMRPGIEEPKS